AAIFLDQLARGDAGRRELDPGLLDPSRYREGAQPLAAVATLAGEPFRALLDDVAHPEQGLDIVYEGRPAEQPDLRRKRRLVARQAAPALDTFQHRRFLAADIGAGAAPQVDPRVRREPGGLDRGDLLGQDLSALRVFVAQVDVAVLGLDR